MRICQVPTCARELAEGPGRVGKAARQRPIEFDLGR